MDQLSRRGFLTGIVKAAAAAELVITATPADVSLFGKGQQVKTGVLEPDLGYGASLGEILFNSKGRPVGVVAGIHHDVATIDVTSHTDEFVRLQPAGITTTLTVVGRGPAYAKTRFNSRP